MEKRAKELLQYQGRSLVEILDENGNTTKFVVCSCFNEKKPMGEKWQWGHYFELWNGTREEMMKAATMYLYDIENRANQIDYDRLIFIASESIKGHFEADSDEAEIFCNETLKLTDEERNELGCPKPKKYDIVTVKFKREFYCEKTLVVPHGTDDYDLDKIIDGDDISDSDFDSCDHWDTTTEMEIIDTEQDNISYQDAYNEHTYNSIDDLD